MQYEAISEATTFAELLSQPSMLSLLTLQEAAVEMNVSEPTIYAMIDNEQFMPVYVGEKRRVPKWQVALWNIGNANGKTHFVRTIARKAFATISQSVDSQE